MNLERIGNLTYSKFNSVFVKRVQEQQKAPTALLKYLNQDVPKGFHYEKREGDNNTYYLRKNDNENPNSLMVRFKFPFEFEGMRINTIVQLLDAMYRTQKSYRVDDELQKNPPTVRMLNGEIDEETFIPQPFSAVDPITLTVRGEKFNIKIKRVPLSDFEKSKFVNQEDQDLFQLEIIVNEKNDSAKINVKVNYSSFNTLDDYFLNREYIKMFYYGKVLIIGRKLAVEDDAIQVFKENDKLFSALKCIQDKLKIKFDFPHTVNDNNLFTIKILFESLINHRVVAVNRSGKLSIGFDSKKTKVKEKAELLGKNMKLFVPLIKEVELFGLKTDLMYYECYTNIRMKEIKEKQNKIIFEVKEDNNNFIYYSNEVDKDELSGEEFDEMAKNAVRYSDITLATTEP